MSLIKRLFSAALSACVFTSALGAQVVASERATISQIVDGTRFTIDYARPRTRGRDSVFGKLEGWGRTWTPGANDATTLEVSRPVHLLGKTVPAGKYSVWLTLREKGPWSFVLDPRNTLFHTATVDSTAKQYRGPVTPEWGGNTETLTWSFPDVSSSGTILEMKWGHVTIRVPVQVTPTFARTVTPSVGAAYVGDYDFKLVASAAPPDRMTVQMHGDTLYARSAPDQFGDAENFQLLPVGGDKFVAAPWLLTDIASTDANAVFEFQRSGGKVVSFEWRSGEHVMAKGTRRKP